MQAKIITDTSDPAYDSLENRYMMVKDKAAKVKEMEQKISRLLVHFLLYSCELVQGLKLFGLIVAFVLMSLFCQLSLENYPSKLCRFSVS